MPIGVWFHKTLSQLLTAILGLMTLWSMGSAIQYDQQRLITSRINSAASVHKVIGVYHDIAREDARHTLDSCHEESTLSEADETDPEGDNDDPSPPWTPLTALAVGELVVWAPAPDQVFSAEVDLFKRRWRLLSAPARSPPVLT